MPMTHATDELECIRPEVGLERRHESHPSQEAHRANEVRSVSGQLWILVAVVVVVAIIFAHQRSRKSQVRQTRNLRMGTQELGRAHSPGEDISQREERRLTGMSAEDRDWKQVSLQRNRDIQDERARRIQGSEDQL